MNDVKLRKSWLRRGVAHPNFDEHMRRSPFSLINRSGYVDPFKLLAWLSGEQNYYSYLKAGHTLTSLHIAKVKAAERRPKYYAAENARRQALAAERRKIRRRATTNPCPTREAILAAWNHRRESHAAAIRFGSLLEDLECYLDNSLRRDENGVIIGRNGGIKSWLFDNLPDVFDMYTTAMRYKAAAKKLKQVAELADPTPAEAALPQEAPEERAEEKCDYGADESAKGRGEVGICGKKEKRSKVRRMEEAVPPLEIVRARAIWMDVVDGVGQSATALIRRLDALTDPRRVEDTNMLAAWREKYANEITERTKKRWWRRIASAAGEKVRRGVKGSERAL
jgi:hypothetical protein